MKLKKKLLIVAGIFCVVMLILIITHLPQPVPDLQNTVVTMIRTPEG